MIDFIEKLKNSSDIREKELGDNISSFNFTRDVFFSSRWNDLNKIARGLFINTQTNEIVARSYPKFFNYEEGNNTLDWLKENIVFPVNVYQKYNGYLGLVSWDKEKNDFFIASKTTNQGDYANWLKDIFLKTIKETNQEERLRAWFSVCQNNCTLVFEVIDIVHDPHIIEYKENKLILLDIVDNSVEFNKASYDSLVSFARDFQFNFKKREFVFNNFEELENLIKNCDRKDIEGFVIEDYYNYMFKFKTEYYKKWKHCRSLKDKFIRSREKGQELNVEKDFEKQFIEFISKYSNEELKNKSIIKIRNEINSYVLLQQIIKISESKGRWIEFLDKLEDWSSPNVTIAQNHIRDFEKIREQMIEQFYKLLG